MTEKLYYKDGYLKEFTANIMEYTKEDNKHSVVLDRTAFFPGGGGQWCDLGYIAELSEPGIINFVSPRIADTLRPTGKRDSSPA